MMRIVASGHALLEAPRPDGDGLWFSDLTGGVWRFDLDAGERLVVPKRRAVGGIALHVEGGLVLTGRTVCHVRDGETRDLHVVDGVVFNDLCTDARGRLWVGGSWSVDDIETPGRRAGAVYRIDSAGDATLVRGGLGIPNGIAFGPDHSVLYVVDSATRHVMAATVDDTTLGPLEVFIDLSRGRPADFGFPPAMPTPDGLAVDEEGGVWVAMLGAGTLDRFTPDGRHDCTVRVPHRIVTSLAFGGHDGRELYITTGRDNDGGGALLTTTVPIPGMGYRPAAV